MVLIWESYFIGEFFALHYNSEAKLLTAREIFSQLNVSWHVWRTSNVSMHLSNFSFWLRFMFDAHIFKLFLLNFYAAKFSSLRSITGSETSFSHIFWHVFAIINLQTISPKSPILYINKDNAFCRNVRFVIIYKHWQRSTWHNAFKDQKFKFKKFLLCFLSKSLLIKRFSLRSLFSRHTHHLRLRRWLAKKVFFS